jgi:hypothetical protein
MIEVPYEINSGMTNHPVVGDFIELQTATAKRQNQISARVVAGRVDKAETSALT